MLCKHRYFTSQLPGTGRAISVALNKWQTANQVDNGGRKVQKLYRKVAQEAVPGTLPRKTCFSAELFQSSVYLASCFRETLVFRLKTLLLQRQAATPPNKADCKSELGVWQHFSYLRNLKVSQKSFRAAHSPWLPLTLSFSPFYLSQPAI